MPYVPSNKTVPPAEDRVILDAALEPVAHKIADRVKNNFSLIKEYKSVFADISWMLVCLHSNPGATVNRSSLGRTIFQVGAKHGYEGAFLGELNYTVTRLIQRVPQIMVERGRWKNTDEFRYWLYAATVSALIWASHETIEYEIGLSGVFEDIKDEYKRRVNTAYEGVQIIKSGDCYDTPYYTRLVPVEDQHGTHVGFIEVQLDRSKVPLGERKDPDKLGYKLILV